MININIYRIKSPQAIITLDCECPTESYKHLNDKLPSLISPQHTDPEVAFNDGDYTAAYFLANDVALKGCAAIMLGAFEIGAKLIGDASDPRSKFCYAITDWSNGNIKAAKEKLDSFPVEDSLAPAASKINTHLSGAKLQLLLQARDDPSLPSHNTIGIMKRLDFADIITVGYSSRSDITIDNHSTLADIIAQLPEGWTPDLYLCNMIEDHAPPVGLEKALFPTLLSTQDFDRHFHHCRPLMPMFDGAIAFGSVFHPELKALCNGRCFVAPLLMGLENDLPDNEAHNKTTDIYVSGNLFNHSEGKTRLLWQLSQLPEKYNIVLQNSHIGRRRYLEKLTQSKFTLTFVQNWGITNSRGFEAISCGCGAFYQDGSELGIFLDQNSSAIPYGIDNFDTVVIDTLDNWTNSADIIGANAAQARQVYDYEEISRRYLILLSVYSALIDKSRKAPSKSKIKNISTIRYPNRSPVRILYNYDGNADNYLDHQQQFRNGLKNKDAYSALDAIGESYLYTHLFKRFVLQVQLDEHIQIMSVAGPKVKKNLQHLQDYDEHHRSEELNLARVTYKKLLDAYPNRLAAHFNYGRICYEIGDKESALATFKHILNDITLYYEPTDLLMWREFQDSLFDYERLMFALRNFEMTQDPTYYKSIKAAILESSLWYLGTILLDRGDHQKALEIFTKYLEPDAELQALFVLKFKLLLRSGKQREASGYIKEIFRNQPWIIAKFGQKIVDGISSNSLDHPLIIEAWLRFKNRLS